MWSMKKSLGIVPVTVTNGLCMFHVQICTSLISGTPSTSSRHDLKTDFLIWALRTGPEWAWALRFRGWPWSHDQLTWSAKCGGPGEQRWHPNVLSIKGPLSCPLMVSIHGGFGVLSESFWIAWVCIKRRLLCGLVDISGTYEMWRRSTEQVYLLPEEMMRYRMYGWQALEWDSVHRQCPS